MSIAYYNGIFSSPEDIRIPLTDRAIYFGDGVYDAAIGRNGKIYMESEHIERFLSNAKIMGLAVSHTSDTLSALLHEAIGLSGESCYFVYFQATRYSSERLHACVDSAPANILITVTGAEPPTQEKRMSLSLYEDKRYLYCDVKTLNLLPSVLASSDAMRRGFDEAIFIRDGIVTECAHSNISIIKNGELFTHPECDKILSGTARRKMIEVGLNLGAVCRDIPFTKETLLDADEVLVTSSTKLCRLAERIEDRRFSKKEGTLGERICEIMHRDFRIFTE